MIKVRYLGTGEFYHGIPARDLDESEYAALSDEQRQWVDSGTLYDVAPQAPEEVI